MRLVVKLALSAKLIFAKQAKRQLSLRTVLGLGNYYFYVMLGGFNGI